MSERYVLRSLCLLSQIVLLTESERRLKIFLKSYHLDCSIKECAAKIIQTSEYSSIL